MVMLDHVFVIMSSGLRCFFVLLIPRPPLSTLFPYTTLFRSSEEELGVDLRRGGARGVEPPVADGRGAHRGRLIHHLAAVICEGREDSAGEGAVGSGLGVGVHLVDLR